VDYLRGARPSYLYHEYLEATNTPELFSDVMARAASHGLGFLAESKLYTMFVSTMGPAARAALEGLEGGQLVQEQYMDFLRLRAFRQSLLVRQDAAPELEIDIERLFAFRLFADLRPTRRASLKQVKPQDYVAADGGSLQVEHPLTKTILERLAEVYPNAMPLEPLLAAASDAVRRAGGGRHAESRDACLMELFNLVVSQGVGLTRRTTAWPNQPGERPLATPLARAQAVSGEGHVASVRHRSLGLDALSSWLLAGLDGRRDRAEILADLAAQVALDDARSAAATTATSAGGLAPPAASSLDRLLTVFARAGLLMDSDFPPRPLEGASGASG
jgi:methyltransferase-like protein